MSRPAVLAGALAAIGALAAVTAPVTNACSGPHASFRESAPSARKVVVGDVVELRPSEWNPGDGSSSRFTVRGWSLLDDVRPEDVAVNDVSSTPCSGQLRARFGDRVAIAFGGVAFTPEIEVNAIAWIDEAPPDGVGLERVTLQEAFDLVGVVRPAVLPVAPEIEVAQPATDLPLPLLGGAVIALLLVAAFFARALRVR